MQKHFKTTRTYLQQEDDYRSFFNKIGSNYTPLGRYSEKCIQKCIDILSDFISDRENIILDVGAGSGHPSKLLGKKNSIKTICLLDLSKEILKANKNTTNYPFILHHLICGDIQCLPVKNNYFNVVLSSCMIHLVNDREKAFNEIYRVLTKDGIFCIITYDPLDISSQIFHKYFPRFNEIDQKRHPQLECLIGELQNTGFNVHKIKKVNYEIIFKDRQEIFNYISTKPYSAFKNYLSSEFENSFSIFKELVEKKLPPQNIKNKCTLTCLVAKKI